MKQIKILFLSGGSAIHTIRWVNGLSKYSNLIINLVSQQDLIDDISNDVIFTKLPYDRKLGYFLNLFKLRDIVRKWKPDLIHVSYASGYGLTANLLRFHPLILSAWGSDIFEFPRRSFFHKKILESNLNNADIIASTSYVMANEIKKISTNKNIVITPFGVDLNKFQQVEPFNVDKNITIGTVKSLLRTYGIDILIKAFAIAYEKISMNDLALAKKMRLKIVGSGSQKSELLKLIEELGLSNIAFIKERVKHEMVPKELQDISIFCNLSREESFGVAVLEASASGIPVITSNRGGLPEVVINKKTGIIIDKLDPENASEAIIDLVTNVNLRKKLGKQGRRFVKDNYNWDDSIIKILEIYKSLSQFNIY